MFWHNFKYSFKTLFRNKMLIFWTFAFPIILGTFFHMAFSNIENSEKLDVIDIAIVNNQDFKNNKELQETFKKLSDKKSDEYLFNIKYVSEDKAKKLLDDHQITGYLIIEKDEPEIVVSKNGINETVFQYVVEQINQTSIIVKDLVVSELENNATNIDYEKIDQDVLKKIQTKSANIENISNENLSYTMIEFYTLIAMVCLYGGILGVASMNQNLANMSSNGKRIHISPISKEKTILSSILASYMVQLIGVALLFIYTIFVLKVDYGTNFPLIILLALIGSLAGLTLGIAIAVLIKASETVKTGIMLSITMLGCFLSGMMGITMKYIIDKNVPIVNKLNPASMITDGFYSLYYYDTQNRYWFDIISLLIFSAVMIFLSLISLRRQKYDSI